MRPLIYVAGPLGLPDIIGWDAVLKNVRNAQAVAMDLVRAGWSPVVPHQNAVWPGAFKLPHSIWLEVDEPLVLVCRALTRLTGPSTGSDIEVRIAENAGIRILPLEIAMLGPSVLEVRL